MTTTVETDQAFRVETRGIDYVPLAERWSRPRDLAGLWAGSSVQFEYLVYGAVLMTFPGFTFKQAVEVILIGNLSYTLLGLCSLQAPGAGTTTFTINRAPFGPNGSRVIALLNWLTQVGFETEGLILVVLAAVALVTKAGLGVGTPIKVIFIVLAAAVQMVLPFLGHATVIKVLRALIIPFAILYVILAILTLGKTHLAHTGAGATWSVWMAGLAFAIVLSGLGWVENGNDFSRYLPPDANRRAIVGWVFVGGYIPEVLIMLLGAAVATYVPSAGDNPIGAFPHAFAGWFLVPFLVVAMAQIFSINSLDLYSSGVTLQALGLRVQRWKAVVIDTVICCGLTAYAVFSASFNTLLTDFADCVIAWIAPWMAVFLVDWALRRYRYHPAELQRTDPGGLYWRQGGVNWRALVAWACGAAASVLAISQTFWEGPIARASDGADFSVFAGIIVGGVVYFVLAGPLVRREAGEQDRLLAGATPDR
ncbi:MAG TPA: cytosine permease [Acidimicrobiales bacterium]|nr:cytosine permease [Acidimicrobiales bacterium]